MRSDSDPLQVETIASLGINAPFEKAVGGSGSMFDKTRTADLCNISNGGQLFGQQDVIHNIAFPESGQLRSRKVVSRSRVRPTGKYPSWKMKRMIHWESENELNAFRLLDCDPDVSAFHEQPCEIEYVLDGESRSHFPDILVERKDQKELWEVKRESQAEKPDVTRRSKLLEQSLPHWGYTYKVVMARDLAMQPRQTNACFLLGFGRRDINGCEREFIRQALAQQGSLLWSDACQGKYGPAGRELLCSLVLKGVLTTDLNRPISHSTRFVTRKMGT
jgi:TnsA endonuclease-like protein